MKKKDQIILKILYVTFTISLLLVWGQSCLNKAESQSYSDVFVDMITPIDQLEIDENHSNADWWEYVHVEAFVRKSAHVIEFGAVGFQLMCITLLRKKRKNETTNSIGHQNNKKELLQLVINCLAIGIFIGLIDETVQIFSSRGSLVSDVWVDALGIVLGIGFALLIAKIYLKRANK